MQGPALDVAASLGQVLAIDINAAAENPLIDTAITEVYHHGQFATPYIALTLGHLRAALHHVAELSTARLSDLVEPSFTRPAPFPGSRPLRKLGKNDPRIRRPRHRGNQLAVRQNGNGPRGATEPVTPASDSRAVANRLDSQSYSVDPRIRGSYPGLPLPLSSSCGLSPRTRELLRPQVELLEQGRSIPAYAGATRARVRP